MAKSLLSMNSKKRKRREFKLFDFLQGTLPSGITFSRASSGTYYNSSGLMVTAGTDSPRFTYNPATHEPRGLLIEEARTNLSPSSETFDDANWNKSGTGTNIVADTAVAPDGNTTMDSYYEGSTSSLLVSANAITVTSGIIHTISWFVKKIPGNIDWVRISAGGSSSIANGVHVYFNISTGVVGSSVISGTGWTYVSGSSYCEDIGNGIYRCSFSFYTGATTCYARIHTATADNNGTRTNIGSGFGIGTGCYIWGCMVEVGQGASSYIKTTTGSAVRSNDNAYYLLNNFSLPSFNTAEGTLYAEFMYDFIGANTNQWLFQIDGGSSVNRISVRFAATVFGGIISVGGSSSSLTISTIPVAKVWNKVAIGYKNNDNSISLNGGANVTETTKTVPTGPTTLRFGQSTGAAFMFGTIRCLVYYSYRKDDATLRTMTT